MRFKNSVDFNKVGLENTFKINEAVKEAELFFSYDLDLIKKENYFSHTKMTVNQVHALLKDCTAYAEIKTYKPTWRWTKAIAYADKRGVIYLNQYLISSRTIGEFLATLCHEFCHLAGFSHGDNSPKGKEHSVPYLVAKIAKENYEKKNGIK